GVDWNDRRQGDRSRGAPGLRPPTDGAGLAAWTGMSGGRGTGAGARLVSGHPPMCAGLADPATRRTAMRSGWLLPLLALVVMVAAPARAEQGVTDTEILLGGSNSFSGPLAFTGEQITKFGVDLGFKAVNDGGGIHGRQVRTIWQDDEYGKSFLTAFEKDLARHGLRLLAVESVKRGVTDVSAQIAKLHAAKPEVTFLVLVPGPGAQALRERQKIGWTDTLMVSTGPLTDERYLSLA